MEKNYDEVTMIKKIAEKGSMYFLHSTPFSERSEFNYSGDLNEIFFFDHLFSKNDSYYEIIEELKKPLYAERKKTIIFIGNQGCGKTTFVHSLQNEFKKLDFLYFDFDQRTSHPTLEEYKERFSNYFHGLICDPNNDSYNRRLYDIYITNKTTFDQNINADNKINNFFVKFLSTFITGDKEAISKQNFILEISSLFFNQILSLITLWHVSRITLTKDEVKPLVFCMDNLDVLVNQEIIENYFKEYFRFTRNIDSILNKLENNYIRNGAGGKRITYDKYFSFILVCRRHTWARVCTQYPHDHPAIVLSTYQKDITEVFDKREILNKRYEYVLTNKKRFGGFEKEMSLACSLLNDMDVANRNIYALFNDDYRQCTITIEKLLEKNPELIKEYSEVKNHFYTVNHGVRGIIYHAIFESFKKDGYFSSIGVLDVNQSHPFVSDARMILNYLDYMTYRRNNSVSFSSLVADFEGIISKANLNKSVVSMFKLGYSSAWNELVAFDKIDTESVENCENTNILITKAGHEYLDFVATHFEFFNIRVTKRRDIEAALFSNKSLQLHHSPDRTYSINGIEYNYKYSFEETIMCVMDIVTQCCKKLTAFYEQYMQNRYTPREYLESPYVYSGARVMHGERIIHTHIRYIDDFRLYLMSRTDLLMPTEEINEILIRFIEEYIRIGESYPIVLSQQSTERLFPAFKDCIQKIKESGYTSNLPINVK